MDNFNDEFRNMMKDLLFGSNGFCKDAPEERKAEALEIINNTELKTLEQVQQDLKGGRNGKKRKDSKN